MIRRLDDGRSEGGARGGQQEVSGRPLEELEAHGELLSRASRRSGEIPPEMLSGHVLRILDGAGWPVQREAMEALLRRISFARRDGLVIAERPSGAAVLGIYATRRKGSSARPYETVLEGVDPPRGSCSCPDFLRSSLGLCKHLLTVVADIVSKPRRFRAGLREQASAPQPTGPRWQPFRPLSGRGDPLAQIVWPDSRSSGASTPTRRWFRRGQDGARILKDTYPDDPPRRLRLVENLLSLLGRYRRRAGAARRDPALRALLESERQRLTAVVRGRIEPRRLSTALRSLKQKLYPYQRQGLQRFLACGRLLLADDMGLGKTAQAIAAATVLWQERRVRRGLLLVPASLKPQWLREWQLFSDVPVEVIDGSRDERRDAYRSTRAGFLIGNYEQLFSDLEHVHDWKPDLVVLDEAQRIKNWATKTATYVKTLEAPYRLVLTGTPMENRIEELASILDWVDDFALEPKWRLVPSYVTPVDGKKEIGGARGLDTIRTRLSGCLLRRVREEVLDQLPPRTDTRIPVEMTPEQLDAHADFDRPIAALLRKAKKRPLTQAEFLRLMQLLTAQRIVSNGLAQFDYESIWSELSRIDRPSEAYLRSLSSPKLVEFRQLVRSIVLEQGRKIVVFSQWRRMLKLAHWATRDLLAGEGLRSAFFSGHEKQKRRTQNIVDFHDDPDTRILFATDAGGVGLNLQRAANCCVNLELPWNPAVLEQRVGRVHRLGQKRPIDVFNLISERGIESRIAGIVESKRALFKSLFDGVSDTVSFEGSGSFLSRIEKIVEPVEVPDLEDREAIDSEGSVEKEIDELLEATNEDGEETPAADTMLDELSPTVPGEPGPARATVPARPGADGTRAVPEESQIAALLSGLEIRKRKDGRLLIEAPPEAASTLSALFDGMARLLRDV